MYGSTFDAALVASKPKEEWVKRNLKTHFPRLKDEESAARLNEVHEACTKAVKESEKEQPAETKTVKSAKTVKPARQEPAL